MKTTFSAIKANETIKAYAVVNFGTLSEQADETGCYPLHYYRDGKDQRMSFAEFRELPLRDDYEMDVYTNAHRDEWASRADINVNAPVDWTAYYIYIARPSLLEDAVKTYNRRNRYSINGAAMAAVTPACSEWIKRGDYLAKKNKCAELQAVGLIIDERTNDRNACDKTALRTANYAEKAFAKFLAAEHLTEQGYLDRCADEDAQREAKEKAAKKAAQERAKEVRYINGQVVSLWASTTIENVMTSGLNTGKTNHTLNYKIGDHNCVTCDERDDWNGYSRGCRFAMTVREFTLTLRKGYHVAEIGGLITFWRGKLDRKGIACEWVEQGRAIADLRTVKGYLVRGEHIEAKSLKEAQRISAEHRTAQALATIKAREEAARRAAAAEVAHKADEEARTAVIGDYRITFEDSLACGNCRPGTQAFKQRVEAAAGHEVTELTLQELREYGRQFGQQYFTNRLECYLAAKLSK